MQIAESTIHFVIPPSNGNVAGIERVTLLCASTLQKCAAGKKIVVHMFGEYRLTPELAEAQVTFHPDCRTFECGKYLRRYLIHATDDIWVICQPMTFLSACIWNPMFLSQHIPIVVLHGALHIEMRGRRRAFQYCAFSKIVKRSRVAVAAVSKSLARYAEDTLQVPQASITTLYNPVFPHGHAGRNRQAPHSERVRNRFRCVAVGRLHEQKGFDLLIKAFHASDVDGRAELLILGEGPQRELLQKLIADGARKNQIRLLGYQPDVSQIVLNSDLFIMSSRYEGLSGALVEALASGMRIVCTDHPFGAREALADGRYGRLVQEPYEETLSDAVSEEFAAWQKGDRGASYDASELSHHLRRFEISTATARYERLINRVQVMQAARRAKS
jgi:glycosyltransferase involved in cell wall biosynthesis